MRDNPSFDPIERFLHDAENRLRRHLHEQQMNEILDEARDHLTQQAQEFTDSGAEPLQAREKAVQSFGDARRWSREIVHARYADAYSGKFHRVVIAATAVALVAATAFQLFSLVVDIQTPAAFASCVNQTCLFVALTCIVVVFAASILSKRSVPWLLALMSTPVIPIVFLVFGANCVLLANNQGPCVRSSLRPAVAIYEQRLTQTQQDLRLLQLGASVYHLASINPSVGIPDALRAPGGYIVPVPGAGRDIGRISSVRQPPPQVLYRESWHALTVRAEKQPYFTVPTVKEAKLAWNDNSNLYIWSDSLFISSTEADIRGLQQAQQRAFQSRFDYPAALWEGRFAAQLAVIMIVVNFIGAQLGRIIVRKKQLNRSLTA